MLTRRQTHDILEKQNLLFTLQNTGRRFTLDQLARMNDTLIGVAQWLDPSDLSSFTYQILGDMQEIYNENYNLEDVKYG